MTAFNAALQIARGKLQALERSAPRETRVVAPGVLLRAFTTEQVIENLRKQWSAEVAVHNAQVIRIESRRSLRGEVLEQFTNRARSLAR